MQKETQTDKNPHDSFATNPYAPPEPIRDDYLVDGFIDKDGNIDLEVLAEVKRQYEQRMKKLVLCGVVEFLTIPVVLIGFLMVRDHISETYLYHIGFGWLYGVFALLAAIGFMTMVPLAACHSRECKRIAQVLGCRKGEEIMIEINSILRDSGKLETPETGNRI